MFFEWMSRLHNLTFVLITLFVWLKKVKLAGASRRWTVIRVTKSTTFLPTIHPVMIHDTTFNHILPIPNITIWYCPWSTLMSLYVYTFLCFQLVNEQFVNQWILIHLSPHSLARSNSCGDRMSRQKTSTATRDAEFQGSSQAQRRYYPENSHRCGTSSICRLFS